MTERIESLMREVFVDVEWIHDSESFRCDPELPVHKCGDRLLADIERVSAIFFEATITGNKMF